MAAKRSSMAGWQLRRSRMAAEKVKDGSQEGQEWQLRRSRMAVEKVEDGS